MHGGGDLRPNIVRTGSATLTVVGKPRTNVLIWLLPPGMVLAVAVGAWIVRGQPLGVLGYVLAAMLLIPLAWVVISALWPASADRKCPACGRDSLVRMSEESTMGLECRSCNWRDESASSWFLAEEEGPLEDVVMLQRGRKSKRKAKRGRSVVDTSPHAD